MALVRNKRNSMVKGAEICAGDFIYIGEASVYCGRRIKGTFCLVKVRTKGDDQMISVVHDSAKVKEKEHLKDTADVILAELQIALECMIEAKKMIVGLHGKSIKTDLLDACIKKTLIAINKNAGMGRNCENSSKMTDC